jgi:O-antigen chain-terminating methyltransferase
VQYLQTNTAYVDTKDRSAGAAEIRERLSFLEQRIISLKREVEASGGETPAGSTDGNGTDVFRSRVGSTTYLGFEDRFRGSQEQIRSRVADYLGILGAAADVVDVGCGRGELLELLRQRGVKARGIDVNHAMVELCRTRGLDVEEADAVSYLERQREASIGGLAAIQVVEHFEPAYLVRFLELAHDKLRAGAPLVLETVNPACWMAFFETYIRDLTHQRPLHPETLKYLVQAAGFSGVDIQFRAPVGAGDRLDRVADAATTAGPLASVAAAVNAHADKLNARLFSSMDYAVIARR